MLAELTHEYRLENFLVKTDNGEEYAPMAQPMVSINAILQAVIVDGKSWL